MELDVLLDVELDVLLDVELDVLLVGPLAKLMWCLEKNWPLSETA